MKAREERFRVGGVSVHAWVGGQGAPLLVLHGAGGNRGWTRWLQRVAERFTVWAPTRLRWTVATLVLALATGPAWAGQCPELIAQARARLEQYRKTPGFAAVKDARIAAVETNLRAAESAHGGGNHDEAMQKANEALTLLPQ